MKFKNLSVAAIASLMLLLFLPVFYFVIFYGNNINYNPDHKIYALYGNKVLLALVGIGVVVFLALVMLLVHLMQKIAYNRRTVSGFAIFTGLVCIVFYFVNVEISKCIAFYGGWDCGMVANSARWVYYGEGMGYGDYYKIFTNNVPITWLLHQLYTVAKLVGIYPYNPEFIWIQFQCLVHAAAVFFSAMTVLITSKKISFATLVLIVNCIFLGLSPWKIIPYTDASTIAFPVVILFLYALFCQMQSGWKYVIWFLIAFLGVMGGIMKATCYVPLIAIVMIQIIWTVCSKERCREKALRICLLGVLLGVGFALAGVCKTGMYRTLDFEYDYDMEIGWPAFLYDGLNEETTGACAPDGMNFVQENAELPRAIREGYERERIKARIEEKGFGGLLDFWLRKQVMTYNDGTFSWFQEGFFQAQAYEDITDSSLKEPLQDFYWKDGEDYLQFVTFSHGIWLFMLVGMIVYALVTLLRIVTGLRKNEIGDEEKAVSGVVILTFIGVFLFLMLFEGRARYLYNSAALFAMMAVVGYCMAAEDLVLLGEKFCRHTK